MDRSYIFRTRRRNSDSDIEESQDNETSSTPAKLNRDSTYCYTKSEHGSDNFRKFTEQRQDGRFIDCFVKVEFEKLPVHRAVLAACSPYFDALWRFNSSVDGPNRTCPEQAMIEVSLDDMSVEAVRAVVDFAYSGSISITYSNVKEILRCADFLCMPSVSEACCKYLEETLDCNDALEIFQLANLINNKRLADGVVLFIAHHFYEFYSRGILFSFDVDLVISILTHDELIVMEEFPFGQRKQFLFVPSARQEEIVLKCVLEYAQHMQDNSVLPRLLRSCVRLTLISSNNLQAFAETNGCLGSEECLEVLRDTQSLKAASCTAADCDTVPTSTIKVPRTLSGVLEIKWSRTLATHRFDTIGDEDFDDSQLLPDAETVLYVTGMKFYSRPWDQYMVIGGIEVTYSNGESVLHGDSDYGHAIEQFVLDADERIIGVTAHSGWMIDGLSFETNKRARLGLYGGNDGGRREIERPARSAYLAFLKGKVMITHGELAVRHLQFGWVYCKNIL